MTHYKVLKNDLSCIYGQGKWKMGEWMPHIEDLVMCESGYHVCREEDLIHWLDEAIFVVDIKGEPLVGDDKIVVNQARIIRKFDTWTDRTAGLFAADCAERVLPYYEKFNVDDKRPHKAIDAARKYANGEITLAELQATKAAAVAAADAAAAAAVAAAVAAGDAADAAWVAGDTADTADAADAAWAAAVAAADAAAAAADAAWAARAATGAAMAARDATGAARAARAAERKWQTERLFQYLNGEV